jgi:prepilin-type N-terminal cleavage/methylation domain-containing protein
MRYLLRSARKGFTLLELLVVIIIVGVLAAVAMPALFRNIERARSTEALTAFGIIHRAWAACRTGEMPGSGNTNCVTFDVLGLSDPGNTPGAHFTYFFTCGSGTCLMWAQRNAVDNGDGASRITWNWNVWDDVATQQDGTSVFQGIQF